MNALNQKEGEVNYQTIPTICPYCGCGCGLLLEVLDGEIVGTLPQKNHPISQGALCIKGWSAHEFVGSTERLKKPLLRENGSFRETSWEEALESISSRLLKIKERGGAESIAGLASAKCTNEENYLMQKWIRGVIGTNNIDHCARL